MKRKSDDDNIFIKYFNDFFKIDEIQINSGANGNLMKFVENINELPYLRTIDIVLYDMDDNELYQFISKLKRNIKCIKLLLPWRERQRTLHELKIYLENNEYIEELEFRTIYQLEEFNNIAESIASCKNLIKLKLHIENLSVEYIVKIIDNCKLLKSIEIDGGINISGEFEKCISRNKSITEIDFGYNIMDMSEIYNFLINNYQLTQIQFRQEDLIAHDIGMTKVFCILELNENWAKSPKEADYSMLQERKRLKKRYTDSITIYGENHIKKPISSHDTLYLFWILKHIFPKEIASLIIGGYYWMKVLNMDNNFVFERWRKFK